MAYTYKIEYDENPWNPREWDNLGTIAHWHRRYDLGERVDDEKDLFLMLARMVDEDIDEKLERMEEIWENKSCIPDVSLSNDRDAWLEARARKWNLFDMEVAKRLDRIVEKHYIMLPVYMYDRSGVTLNTTGFSCRWDSGQVGWIYVSIADVKKQYGWKNMSQKRRELIKTYLRGEIETYAQYLEGDVWGYVITDDVTEEIVDSCWGFFGQEYCEEEAESAMEYYRKKEQEEAVELMGVTPNYGMVSVL